MISKWPRTWPSASMADAPELEVMAPVPLSAVCFRFAPATPALARQNLTISIVKILKRVQHAAESTSPTPLFMGASLLRACIVNHRTTPADVEAVVDEVVEVGNTQYFPRPRS